MKKISVCVPCRNEVDNIAPLAEAIEHQLNQFEQYEHEILFIDNLSDDGTQGAIRSLCATNGKVKAILNAKNFPEGSGMHVLFQASGDCVISIPADFQVPPELIPDIITEWEKGARVVALMKVSSKKDKARLFRKLYYSMSKHLSTQDTLPGFTGSGLYDKSFLDVCKACKDPLLSMRYMVSQYAAPLVKMEYTERPRRSGKSKHSAISMIDVAIKRFIRVSTVAPRVSILSGLFMGLVCLLVAVYYIVRKLLFWDDFSTGIAPLVIGVFLIGAIQLIVLGIMGEYIMLINNRQKNEPRVVESERINFSDDNAGGSLEEK